MSLKSILPLIVALSGCAAVSLPAKTEPMFKAPESVEELLPNNLVEDKPNYLLGSQGQNQIEPTETVAGNEELITNPQTPYQLKIYVPLNTAKTCSVLTNQDGSAVVSLRRLLQGRNPNKTINQAYLSPKHFQGLFDYPLGFLPTGRLEEICHSLSITASDGSDRVITRESISRYWADFCQQGKRTNYCLGFHHPRQPLNQEYLNHLRF